MAKCKNVRKMVREPINFFIRPAIQITQILFQRSTGAPLATYKLIGHEVTKNRMKNFEVRCLRVIEYYEGGSLRLIQWFAVDTENVIEWAAVEFLFQAHVKTLKMAEFDVIVDSWGADLLPFLTLHLQDILHVIPKRKIENFSHNEIHIGIRQKD